MCNTDEREYCCECWDAEDLSCRRDYEHDYEPAPTSDDVWLAARWPLA